MHKFKFTLPSYYVAIFRVFPLKQSLILELTVLQPLHLPMIHYDYMEICAGLLMD